MPRYRANKELEAIIRPIVEGQIRGFLKEHPVIIDAVDWYKPRTDKAKTLTSSLSKRIVRDLACGITSARMAAVLVERPTASQPTSPVEYEPAEKALRREECLAWAFRWLGRIDMFPER
jgi:hypothetical protein